MEFLGFFSALGYFFSDFFFYQFLVIFKRMPRLGPLVGFGQPNPSGRTLFSLPRPCLKCLISFSIPFQTFSRPFLSYFLHSTTPKSSIFPLFTSIASQIFKITLKSKCPNSSFKTLTAHIQYGLPWHPRQVQRGKERSLFARIHLPILTILCILLLKPSKGIQLEPSLLE